MNAPRFALYAERGCPFAHRVRALFAHLDIDYTLVEGAPAAPPPELARWSTSGRAPVLVDGEVGFGESRVMLEHVAHACGFADAYPASLIERTLQREAMTIVDENIAVRLLAERPIRPARLADYLDRLGQLARRTPPTPSLIAFHIAPIWQRFQWWRSESPITHAIRERPELVAWLDALARLPAIVATSPTRAENIVDFEAVCALAATA